MRREPERVTSRRGDDASRAEPVGGLAGIDARLACGNDRRALRVGDRRGDLQAAIPESFDQQVGEFNVVLVDAIDSDFDEKLD